MMDFIMKINKNNRGYKSYSPLINTIYIILSLTIIISIWALLSKIINLEVTFPMPSSVFEKLKYIIMGEDFWTIVLTTFKTCMITFIIALLAGIILGIIAGVFKPLFYLLQPLIVIIKTTPVISIILLALIWFRKITPNFAGFLVTFPVIYSNVLEGVREIDYRLIEMAKMYKVKKASIIKNVYLPSIVSYVFAGISIGWGMTIKAVVAAEVLSQPPMSIGTVLQDESIYLETAGVFAWTIVIVVMSFVFESLFRLLQHRLQRWR
ncbi:ABC transporter permease subunit [Clostridiaceae bacterium M8S5]|nr:ABC transporter permease subunit [Clostridiaceae bacterium M8S5]